MFRIKSLVVTLTLIFSSSYNFAQSTDSFVDQCLGEWSGLMYMYGNGNLRDSVPVKFLASKTDSLNLWIWRTTYLSEPNPLVKDYLLRKSTSINNLYYIDEGDGIILNDYLFGNKLYGVFETEGILLTSSYELNGDQLIFEVTSGKKIMSNSQEVKNYSVDYVQRVTLERLKK